MTLKRKEITNSRRRTINIGGDDIKIVNQSFSISEANWTQFKGKMKEVWDENPERRKSQAIRILVNAVNLGVVDLEDLEKKVEKASEKVDFVVYV